MRIENREYINLRIRESLYFYLFKDKDLKFKENELKNKERVIYFKFLEYIEKEYKLKIKEIDNLKEDIIYYELNNILLDLIESLIY